MKTYTFHEYVNSKGKLSKPVVSLNGDTVDPATFPEKPPQGGKPYQAKDGKSKKSNKGFADMGDESLVYKPKTGTNEKGKSPAKLPTVEEMALASRVVKALKNNPALIETVVRQIKEQGLLGVLLGEMLNHGATYKHLSEVMAHESYGPDLCKKLVRAMNEEVAKPFSDQLDLDDEDDFGEEDDLGLDLDDELDDEDEFGDDLEGLEDDLEDDLDGEMDPNMDPSMGDAGVDPMMDMDPSMMQNHPAMANLQRAMMRAFMRKMMGKQ